MAADRRPGLRGATAVVGIGQTPYYKRGQSPDDEQTLCLKAIVAACEDAGLGPEDVDGFVSYGADHCSGPSLMTALGTRELRFSTLVWNGGGGGVPGALGVAAERGGRRPGRLRRRLPGHGRGHRRSSPLCRAGRPPEPAVPGQRRRVAGAGVRAAHATVARGRRRAAERPS